MITCVVGIKAISNIPIALSNMANGLDNYNYVTFTKCTLILSHGLNLFIYIIFIESFRKSFLKYFRKI